MWPEKLGGLLTVFCSDVSQIVIEVELEQEDIKDRLMQFAKQVPYAIETFGMYKAEEWKLTLQTLCSENWPDKSHLCEIWKLLVKIYPKEAYEFLVVLFKKTIGGMLRKEPLNGQVLRVEPDVADTVAGAIHHLFIQCIEVWSGDKVYWDLLIKPEIYNLLNEPYGSSLKQECPNMHDYLSNDMIRAIEGVDYNRMKITTEKIKILFVAANPKDIQPLALGEEIREIENKIRATKYRDSLVMIQKWATRYDDLQQALLEHRPHIVHFSGHGTTTSEILLKDTLGNAQPINQDALKELFNILKDNIRGVILNACYSNLQAKAIIEVIDFAIGMKKEIGDKAAIQFAASFYRAIGFNKSVREGFDLGVNSLKGIGIADADIPDLLVRKGVDSSNIYLLHNQ